MTAAALFWWFQKAQLKVSSLYFAHSLSNKYRNVISQILFFTFTFSFFNFIFIVPFSLFPTHFADLCGHLKAMMDVAAPWTSRFSIYRYSLIKNSIQFDVRFVVLHIRIVQNIKWKENKTSNLPYTFHEANLRWSSSKNTKSCVNFAHLRK